MGDSAAARLKLTDACHAYSPASRCRSAACAAGRVEEVDQEGGSCQEALGEVRLLEGGRDARSTRSRHMAVAGATAHVAKAIHCTSCTAIDPAGGL